MRASAILVIIGLMVGTSQAALFTFVGDTGGSWHVLANWTSDGEPAVSFPTTADSVHLNGRTVHITEAAALSVFQSGSSGTVNIDSGGVLTGSGDNSLRYVGAINVNDGGVFNMSNGLIRTTVTIHEGGTAWGSRGIPQAESRTLTVNGTFSPRGTTSTARNFVVGSSSNASYWGRVVLGDTGTVILDTYDNGINEFFQVSGFTSNTWLTLNTGAIELRLQGDYAPEMGHAFTLWTLGADSEAIMTLGNGSNISMPGLATGLSLNTSLFETTGVVTVIPEPGTLGLVAGMGVLLALRRRLRA